MPSALHAAWRFAGARLRIFGLRPTHPNWQLRAETCATCHLCVVRSKIAYCGKPLLHQLHRDPTLEGCGCPCQDKAKHPDEHCPITPSGRPAETHQDECNCKWCTQ